MSPRRRPCRGPPTAVLSPPDAIHRAARLPSPALHIARLLEPRGGTIPTISATSIRLLFSSIKISRVRPLSQASDGRGPAGKAACSSRSRAARVRSGLARAAQGRRRPHTVRVRKRATFHGCPSPSPPFRLIELLKLRHPPFDPRGAAPAPPSPQQQRAHSGRWPGAQSGSATSRRAAAPSRLVERGIECPPCVTVRYPGVSADSEPGSC